MSLRPAPGAEQVRPLSACVPVSVSRGSWRSGLVFQCPISSVVGSRGLVCEPTNVCVGGFSLGKWTSGHINNLALLYPQRDEIIGQQAWNLRTLF